jgi:hypothetical protein
MAENSRGVVVTENMITSAVLNGDLESLVIWAGQGVRVKSARLLFFAAGGGHLEALRCLVQELADVDKATSSGTTPLLFAARRNHVVVVLCLVQLGAEVGAVDKFCDTALHVSATSGTMQYLLEEAGASMDDANNRGQIVWAMLIERLTAYDDDDEDVEETEPTGLTGLLRVLMLRGPPPPALMALLSPEPARVVQEGARLRARLPAYLAHRRAYLDSRCPRISVFPGVLRALIYGFEGPATTEELWAARLLTALAGFTLLVLVVS